ncbi:hypothetical protein ACFUJX_11370 [Streptomyces rubiginosohelvolus]|uniref:hypothetical protein n=1 Tax=Streptomyces rubiginosohelvolus TaxID=67362 RepID=UPI00363DC155
MIRIVTKKRLALMEADATAAFERAQRAKETALLDAARRAAALAEVTERAERAEATTDEVGAILSTAMKELSAAQQDLLLKDIELRRLRDDLAEARAAGREVHVLLHYGTPVMVYRSREDAYADTATHGAPADATWHPAGERFWGDQEWLVSTFTYDADARGFRGALEPVAESVRGAA